MKKTFARKTFTGSLIMLGIAVAYSGHLFTALAIGALATIVVMVDDFKVTGDEEG